MSFSVDPYTVYASMDGEYTVPAGIWSPWPGAICRIANNEPDAKSNPEASNATGDRKLEEAIESSERLHKWPLVDIAPRMKWERSPTFQWDEWHFNDNPEPDRPFSTEESRILAEMRDHEMKRLDASR